MLNGKETAKDSKESIMFSDIKNYPVGARIVVRDAEWRITEVDMTKHAGVRIACVGLSELVRRKKAVFFDLYEKSITLLKPEETRLIEDHSPGFQKSKLYLEALLRSAPKTDPNKIEVAHKAAMDPMPYQFNPVLQALKQPRARILIADAVGIGKTLEAGILTSELIARGRGRRILVLATKAMLNQFQQEFWNRFSIPLVRLDSAGIQRVRSRIPASHNPFLYFDRAIISIDTLKQDIEYRDFLQNAYWDIIIIDEAHNVALRNNHSQRAKLAQLLANRSDTMVMLSATPHDGKPESFASLMNILDPTAIVNPQEYQLSDFSSKGLVIRRFKSDVREQVQQDFPDRKIELVKVDASAAENAVFTFLESLTFNTLDNKESLGAKLFATTLTKAFFSSPAACISVIKHRIARLEKQPNRTGVTEDIQKLKELLVLVEAVQPKDFKKLTRLAEMLGNEAGSIGWNKADAHDRLVIFTESIETLEFLKSALPKEANLTKNEVIVLTGAMKDTEIAEAVNQFNRGDSAARVLLCSDVASEGINLHHFAHRMIHFDIPWSLMTFQQRNGRIDRYGQTKKPEIWYLQTVGKNEKSIGDARVLELLMEKDQRAQHNLSDPAEFFLTEKEQTDKTAATMEGQVESMDDFDDIFSEFDDLDPNGGHVSTAIAPVLTFEEYKNALAKPSRLYRSDMDFAKSVLRLMNEEGKYDRNQLDLSQDRRILLSINPELQARIKYLPAEVLPEDGRFDLTDDVKLVQQEMQRVRAGNDEWPKQTLLWPLHPVMSWLEDHVLGLFGRHTAPVVRLPSIRQGERWCLLQGGYPNRRGYIPIHRWVVVHEIDGRIEESTLEALIASLKLDRDLSNLADTEAKGAETEVTNEFKAFVEQSVQLAYQRLAEAKEQFDKTAKADLENRVAELEALKEKHILQMTLAFEESNQIEAIKKSREEAKRAQIESNFKAASEFITNTATTEDEAYLQLAAVFSGIKR